MTIDVRFCYEGYTGGLEGLHVGPISPEFACSNAQIIGRCFETRPIAINPEPASSLFHRLVSSLPAMWSAPATPQAQPTPLRYGREYVTFDCIKRASFSSIHQVLRLSNEEFASMRIRVPLDAPSGRRMPDILRMDGTIKRGVPFLVRIAHPYAKITPSSSDLGRRLCVVITPDNQQLNSFSARFENDTTVSNNGDVPFTLTVTD